MHANSESKHIAVKYDFERLKAVATDVGSHINTIDAQQAFLQFCADFNALGDWVVRDGIASREEWQEALQRNDAMFLVAKIDTVNKHAAADKEFWARKFNGLSFNKHVTIMTPSHTGLSRMVARGRYEIHADAMSYDALIVAKCALAELEGMLEEKGELQESVR